MHHLEAGAQKATGRAVKVSNFANSDLIRILFESGATQADSKDYVINYSLVIPIRAYGKVRVTLEGARATFVTDADRVDVAFDPNVTVIPIRRGGVDKGGAGGGAAAKGVSATVSGERVRTYDADTKVDYAQCQKFTHINRADTLPTPAHSTFEILIKKPNPYVDAIDGVIPFAAKGTFAKPIGPSQTEIGHLHITGEGDPTFIDAANTRIKGWRKVLANRDYRRERLRDDDFVSSSRFVVEAVPHA